jgi:hypothetical protein
VAGVSQRAPTSTVADVTGSTSRDHLTHLARRLVGSLSRRPASVADDAWARGLLLPGEAVLWERMSNVDRRHAVEVARRFAPFVAAASGEVPDRDEMAAALLHDVGKVDTAFGTAMRVVATVVGPRTARLRRYHEHERVGLELLRAAGSSAITMSLAASEHPHAEQLRAADDI